MRTLLPALLLCACGCGGSSSGTSGFSGNWSGTGTLTNSSGKVLATGSVTQSIDNLGDVNGTDTVTVGGGSETESGLISGNSVTLTLTQGQPPSQTVNTAYMTGTLTNGTLTWTGTESISGSSFTVTYTLTASS